MPRVLQFHQCLFLVQGLASRPDCLFVEEEDTEDLTNFDTDNDFVYQGLFQLSTVSKIHLKSSVHVESKAI